MQMAILVTKSTFGIVILQSRSAILNKALENVLFGCAFKKL
jgi:hypothetical protein